MTDGVVNLADFEGLARTRMDRAAFEYVAGGAGDELTLANNRAAFARYQLLPRVLRDVSVIDTSTTFLGAPVTMPVGIAPMAFQHYAHPNAEVATAAAAAGAGVLMCLSTLSSRSLEEVAQEGGSGPRWFQLYVHRDRARSEDLVRRAEAAGYSAIVLTVDLPVAGNRERDLRNNLQYPVAYGNFTGGTSTLGAAVGAFNDTTLNWADVAWVRSLSNVPLVIKGILTAPDARLAVQHGAAAVIVSNHGGRQLDRTPAAIDCVADIVDAVGDTAEIYVDGGVRRGVDVLTALAVGAHGVLVGRPINFALAAAGEQGVARALAILAAELRTDMALLGTRSVGEITQEFVRRV